MNENNNNFYQNNLCNFNSPLYPNKLNDSEKLLWKCYNFYKDKVQNYFKDGTASRNLAMNLQTIAKNLKFITILVQDDLSAYTVFETLNARGTELTPADLLKNYLFSKMKSETDLRRVHSKWKNIADVSGLRDLPDFLRCFLNGRKKMVRKENLFKVLKTEYTTPKEVFTFLNELDGNVQIYAALKNPNDELWNRKQKYYIDKLRLFQVRQPRPLLMVAYKKLNEQEFLKLLKDIVAVSFRYNVICGLNPNEQERVYNLIATELFEGKIRNLTGIRNHIKQKIYVSNENFEAAFYEKIFTKSRKPLAKYTLCEIENYIFNSEIDYLLSDASIEHILPEEYSNRYPFSKDQHQQYVYRLGNLTLLEEKKNNKIGGKEIKEKRKAYATSKYKMTKQIDTQEWATTSIEDRQKKWAKHACQIWHMSI